MLNTKTTTNFLEVKNMKKRSKLIIFLILLLLTACGTETPHAFVSVTTSAGDYCSYLSSNYMDDAETSAVWVVNNKEVTVSVFFSCPTCKYEETWEASTVSPQSKLFTCECTAENNDTIGMPEYFAITVTTGETFFGIKEK